GRGQARLALHISDPYVLDWPSFRCDQRTHGRDRHRLPSRACDNRLVPDPHHQGLHDGDGRQACTRPRNLAVVRGRFSDAWEALADCWVTDLWSGPAMTLLIQA